MCLLKILCVIIIIHIKLIIIEIYNYYKQNCYTTTKMLSFKYAFIGIGMILNLHLMLLYNLLKKM